MFVHVIPLSTLNIISRCLLLAFWLLSCLFSSILQIMAQFLLPLSNEQVRIYFERDSLVEVAVSTSAGITDIVTFDPLLLPSHLKNDFLTQLFQWAHVELVLPLSSFGTWEGKNDTSKTMDLLPHYWAWLDMQVSKCHVVECLC